MESVLPPSLPPYPGFASRSKPLSPASSSAAAPAATTADEVAAVDDGDVAVTAWKEELDTLLQASHKELLAHLDQRLEVATEHIIRRLDGHGSLLETSHANHHSLSSRLCQQLEAVESKLQEKVTRGARKSWQKKKSLEQLEVETAPKPTMGMHIIGGGGEDHLDLDRRLQSAAEEMDRSLRSDSTMSNEPKKLSLVQKLVKDKRYQAVIAIAIFSNAVFIGIQTNAAAHDPHGEESFLMFAANIVFTILFTAELGLRLASHGLALFKHDIWWNIMDVLIVLTSILEAVFEIMAKAKPDSDKDQSSGDTSQLRVLRILRVTRLIRGIRVLRVVRFIRALRVLVYQITSTIKALVWALVLLVIIIYLFALSFTQATTGHRKGLGFTTTQAEPTEALLQYWSTVPRSMYTLFNSITGGISWIEVAHPLSDLDFIWILLFVAYICFGQMAVLNVLTGVFCQNAIDSAAHDRDLVTQSILQDKKRYIDEISQIFKTIDEDASGSITITEFKNHMQEPKMQAYFESFGLDASDVWTLFKLLDMDTGAVIELDEFVSGCLRLKGNAKGLDMAKLCYEHKFLDKRISEFIRRTDRRLSFLLGEDAEDEPSQR